MFRVLYLIVVIAISSLSGCQAWQLSESTLPTSDNRQSLLKPVDLAADGFRLEILTVRFPLGEPDLNGSAWSQIDEQFISTETRRMMSDNGFRAGLIVGQLPDEISRLLVANEQPATVMEAAANFSQPPVVSRQVMQLHSGWRGQIVASKIYDEIPLLLRDGDDVIGKPYRLAQGIFNVGAVATGDRRVKIQLTPELHHGEPRQMFISEPEDGQLRPQSGKQKKIFDNFAFEITLAPEQMLVLTSLPNRRGTLGHYFLTEPQADQLQQKLVIVRLEQTKYSDLFAEQKIAEDPPAQKK